MKVFRGNCAQVRILEKMIIVSGLGMLVDYPKVNIPLFQGQKDFRSIVTHRKYWMKTDATIQLIPGMIEFPKMYSVVFEYDEDTDKGSVSMTREAVDYLAKVKPEVLEGLKNGSDAEAEKRKVIPKAVKETADY